MTGRSAWKWWLGWSPVIGAICVLLMLVSGAHAQPGAEQWSQPVQVFETTGELYYPTLASDRAGNVYALWRHTKDRADSSELLEALYISRLDAGGWSPPVDVVASPFVGGPSAVVDEFGSLHVIWVSGDNRLHYVRVRPDEALSARVWQAERTLADSSLFPQIQIDTRGALHVAYPGLGTTGVYYITSADGGDTWSPAANVSPTSDMNSMANYTYLSVGGDGTIHVIWTEFQAPGSWPPLGVFYAHSTDGGQTWTPSIQLAGAGYDQGNVLAVGRNEVHVAWNGAANVRGRYHRWSSDGGLTWSDPDVLAPDKGGTEGPPTLVVDSAGGVHLLMSHSGCAWHTAWDGRRWSEPVCTSATLSGQYMEETSMSLSEGNRLHVVFWENRKRLWYTTSRTSAPHVPSQSLPAVPVPSKPQQQATVPSATVTPGATPARFLATEAAINPSRQDTSWPVVIGVVPAALLVFGVLVAGAMRSHR